MSPSRIIIVGAGIGGLAAALRLAAAGHAVTVLESGPGPGGKARNLDSAAGPVAAGPTVLTLRDVFDDLFSDAGVAFDDHVDATADPLLARHFWTDGSCLDLHADADANAAAIRDFAGPRAERQFRRFDADAARLFAAFDGPVMRSPRPSVPSLARRVAADPGLLRAMAPFSTLAGHLSRRFDDPRLVQLFGRYATYVGGHPQATPALLSLIWRAEAGGVWRIAGGIAALARAIERVARARGAVFHYNTSAATIITRSGRAAGVVDATETRHEGDAVLFAGDPRALVTGLLGADAVRAVPGTAVDPRSLSAEVWSFAATPHGPDLAHHNVFFGADPATEFAPIAKGDAPRDPTFYICAQDRGAGLVPPALERFEIIVNAAPLGPHGDETPCTPRPFDRLADRGLSFTPRPVPQSRTGPAGFATLFPASLGSLYGRSPHGMTAAMARPTARSGLPGLYLAGGGAHPGAGVPMAALSGRHAAETITNDLAST